MKLTYLILCAAAVSFFCSVSLATEVHPEWRNSLKPKGSRGVRLDFASKGKPKYTILLPATPTAQDEKAAADLSYWLEEMTGAKFATVREDSGYKPTGREISVGRTDSLAKAKLDVASVDLGNEGYGIAVQGKTLYLLGGRQRGPINAVYSLLEEDLGCRWYAAGERYVGNGPPMRTESAAAGTYIPHIPDLKVGIVPRRFVPALDTRDPYLWDAFDTNWSLRNRTNSPHVTIPKEWGGFTFCPHPLFVHTFNALMPSDQYYRDHPEYYAEVNGKRTFTQLCLTNPDVLKIVTARVHEVLRLSPQTKILSVSPNDNGDYCECTNCKAIDDREGTKAGTLLLFVNAVADAVLDEYPDVKISTLAYMGTIVPPETVKPRENVMIQLCTDSHACVYPFHFATETEKFQSAMRAWAGKGAKMYIWDYVANFQHYLNPLPNLPVIAPNIRFYIENGAKGVMLQGNYQNSVADNTMRCWVFAKLLWDPSRDTRELMRDFIYGYYGKAAEPLWKYHSLLWKIWEKNHSKPWAAGNPLFEKNGYTFHPDIPFLSDGFVSEASSLFDEAEKLAVDPETMCRVKLQKLPILYVKLCHWIGYYSKGGDFYPGKMFREPAERRTAVKGYYAKILDELEASEAQLGGWLGEGIPPRLSEWRKMLENNEESPAK